VYVGVVVWLFYEIKGGRAGHHVVREQGSEVLVR
jgi:hypothetical protein